MFTKKTSNHITDLGGLIKGEGGEENELGLFIKMPDCITYYLLIG